MSAALWAADESPNIQVAAGDGMLDHVRALVEEKGVSGAWTPSCCNYPPWSMWIWWERGGEGRAHSRCRDAPPGSVVRVCSRSRWPVHPRRTCSGPGADVPARVLQPVFMFACVFHDAKLWCLGAPPPCPPVEDAPSVCHGPIVGPMLCLVAAVLCVRCLAVPVYLRALFRHSPTAWLHK
jgi:hypothetical protein